MSRIKVELSDVVESNLGPKEKRDLLRSAKQGISQAENLTGMACETSEGHIMFCSDGVAFTKKGVVSYTHEVIAYSKGFSKEMSFYFSPYAVQAVSEGGKVLALASRHTMDDKRIEGDGGHGCAVLLSIDPENGTIGRKTLGDYDFTCSSPRVVKGEDDDGKEYVGIVYPVCESRPGTRVRDTKWFEKRLDPAKGCLTEGKPVECPW